MSSPKDDTIPAPPVIEAGRAGEHLSIASRECTRALTDLVRAVGELEALAMACARMLDAKTGGTP